MTVRLYVVTDKINADNYLVCAKTRSAAMNYIAKSVLMKLSSKPATPIQVVLSGFAGEKVLGEPADLAAIGMGSADADK